MLLRPLPPFRAKPARRPLTPKTAGDKTTGDAHRNGIDPITVKARRHPVKFARLGTAPSLKVLTSE